MSYISTTEPAPMAGSTRAPLQGFLTSSAPPPSASAPLSAGLEILVFLTMLSGVSLALCTIVAGAFHQPIW